MAVTDPLPLVPATMTEAKARSGWPSAAQSARDVLEAELDAEVLEAEEELERIDMAWAGTRRQDSDCDGARRRRPTARAGGAGGARPRTPKRSTRAIDVLQLAAIDDHVEHAVLEQELAALEALGQLLADRLLDDARAGEADQRLRLGDVQSPSIAKLAVTPPVVGSVSTEMYGSRARSSRASAALILAICISDSAPSIIRAPPEQRHDDRPAAAARWRARSRA